VLTYVLPSLHHHLHSHCIDHRRTMTTTVTPTEPVTPQKHNFLPTSPTPSSFCYSALIGTAVGDDLLNSCAQLFSTNYGVWGENAATISKFTKPGLCLVLSAQGVARFSHRTTCQDDWQKAERSMPLRSRENRLGDLLQAYTAGWPRFRHCLELQRWSVIDCYRMFVTWTDYINRCCWMGYPASS
jgi:hypothetical protein